MNAVYELTVPELGESIRDVQIGPWLKEVGQWVERDENLVAIESDKATVDVPAPVTGVLVEILKPAGAAATVGEVIARLDPDRRPPAEASQAPAEAPAGPPPEGPAPSPEAPAAPPAETSTAPPVEEPEAAARAPQAPAGTRQEEVVPMTRVRRQIAQRLVAARQTAALLTTFNEVDMSAVGALRERHRRQFEEQFQAKLGLMSFFVKAAIEALKRCPALNAEIRGTDIVYRNYYDVGIAVGGGQGLVVPVLRNAERLSFAEIERAIADFAARSQTHRLTPQELSGGTFTITNGGVFGSLLSTPLVNPPQSGILGMHAIQQRPVAREGQVVIRPMMYVALTYDHRLIDGREAVGFLVRIKELVEDPARILLEM